MYTVGLAEHAHLPPVPSNHLTLTCTRIARFTTLKGNEREPASCRAPTGLCLREKPLWPPARLDNMHAPSPGLSLSGGAERGQVHSTRLLESCWSLTRRLCPLASSPPHGRWLRFDRQIFPSLLICPVLRQAAASCDSSPNADRERLLAMLREI